MGHTWKKHQQESHFYLPLASSLKQNMQPRKVTRYFPHSNKPCDPHWRGDLKGERDQYTLTDALKTVFITTFKMTINRSVYRNYKVCLAWQCRQVDQETQGRMKTDLPC